MVTKTKREFLVLGMPMERLKQSSVIPLFESHSCDCTLNDMVENFNNTFSSALNTLAPLKVKKRLSDRISLWLNSKSVNEIKRIC